MSFPSRRDLILGSLAGLAASSLPSWAPAAEVRPPLRDLAMAKGLLYGTTVADVQLFPGDDFTDLVVREAACIVPENEMKWFLMSEHPDQADYEVPDRMVKFAGDHELMFRGHNLLWYWKTPYWFQELPDRRASVQSMLRRIGDLAGRYKGRIHSWDVVNEPIRVEDGRGDYLRAAIFVEQIGPEYLDLAYGAARAADPKARLVFNEYDVEYDTPEQDQKRLAVLKVLEGMKARGTPVDVLGVQGHLTIGRHKMSDRKFRQFLRDVAQMGLEIQITELDVSDELAPAGIPERDRLIADEYRHFLDVALDEPAVRMVMTWGLSDRHSWIVRHETNEMYWRQDGVDSRPLPFDAALQPKPAWEAIATALANAPKR